MIWIAAWSFVPAKACVLDMTLFVVSLGILVHFSAHATDPTLSITCDHVIICDMSITRILFVIQCLVMFRALG